MGKRALIALCMVLLGATGAEARGRPASAGRVSEILIDASSGRVLYARSPDALRRPASLTKMMTLFLAFDALESGRLRLSDTLTMSRHAASQPPSRLGLGRGKSIGVEQALRIIAAISANDVTVALAERLGGSEERFVQMMTAKAQRLGMRHTRFANATGLTNRGNVTTAREMAALSVALLKRHPREYGVFSTRAIHWGRRHVANHNHLLGKVPGVDGIKTGYTVDAGYNLAASSRQGGRRVVAVVLGERSVADRDLRVSNLLQMALGQRRASTQGSGRAVAMWSLGQAAGKGRRS